MASEAEFTVYARYGHASLGDQSYLRPIVEAASSLGSHIIVADVQDSYYRTLDRQAVKAVNRRSVLCMPIRLANSRFPMILYMENRALNGVFTEQTATDVEEVVTKYSYLLLFQLQAQQTEQHRITAVAPSSDAKYRVMALEPLTLREEEVLKALVRGMSNKEIAEELFISEMTVKTHVHRLYAKLGVKRRGQAIALAREIGLA
ncbi:MAG: response regulator transcription factor [Cohnella sp.]|nr:response regulator transcription factor [Cohnella sp.]